MSFLCSNKDCLRVVKFGCRCRVENSFCIDHYLLHQTQAGYETGVNIEDKIHDELKTAEDMLDNVEIRGDQICGMEDNEFLESVYNRIQGVIQKLRKKEAIHLTMVRRRTVSIQDIAREIENDPERRLEEFKIAIEELELDRL